MNIDKLCKRLEKLSTQLDKTSPADLEKLRSIEPEIDQWCETISDVLGSSNPYWRIHPNYPNIKCSINGEITVSGYNPEFKETSGQIKVIFDHGKKKYNAAELILSCFKPCPGPRKQYQIGYLDKDFHNIKPSNLYWERIVVR